MTFEEKLYNYAPYNHFVSLRRLITPRPISVIDYVKKLNPKYIFKASYNAREVSFEEFSKLQYSSYLLINDDNAYFDTLDFIKWTKENKIHYNFLNGKIPPRTILDKIKVIDPIL